MIYDVERSALHAVYVRKSEIKCQVRETGQTRLISQFPVED